MKIPVQLFVVKGTVYPFDIAFSIGQSDKTLSKFLSRYEGIDVEYEINALKISGVGRTTLLKNNSIVVRLAPEWDMVDFHANVAHEIFHAATFLMENIGMKLEIMVSDEAYAYLIGWLTREFYKSLKVNNGEEKTEYRLYAPKDGIIPVPESREVKMIDWDLPHCFPKEYKIPLNTEVVLFTTGSNHVPITGKTYSSISVLEGYSYQIKLQNDIVTEGRYRGDVFYPVNPTDHPHHPNFKAE